VNVFITATGSKYHLRDDLECTEKAHGLSSVDLDVAGDMGLRACITCEAPAAGEMSEGDGRWLRTIDDWQQKSLLETRWESAFARRVLARIPELSSDDVQPQAYISADGKQTKVDFLIEKCQLVIEVDGFSKDGEALSQTDVERRNRRDSALTSSGFMVIHFSNTQVSLEAQDCARQIQNAIGKTSSIPPVAFDIDEKQTGFGAVSQPHGNRVAPSLIIVVALVVFGAVIAGVTYFVVGRGTSQVAEQAQTIAPAVSSSEFPGESSNTTDASSEAVDVGSSGISAEAVSWVEPISKSECPANNLIKGLIKGGPNPDGNDFIHVPGGKFYETTSFTRCYSSAELAFKDGFVQYFEDCDSARVSGLTPLTKGTDMYDANDHLDGDEDGVACE
jgi:very-short-patch-repair endonuclease